MHLKIIGLILMVASTSVAGALQAHSNLLISHSAGKVISRTTTKSPDGSALYSTTVLGHSTTYHWNLISPLAATFLFGLFLVRSTRTPGVPPH